MRADGHEPPWANVTIVNKMASGARNTHQSFRRNVVFDHRRIFSSSACLRAAASFAISSCLLNACGAQSTLRHLLHSVRGFSREETVCFSRERLKKTPERLMVSPGDGRREPLHGLSEANLSLALFLSGTQNRGISAIDI